MSFKQVDPEQIQHGWDVYGSDGEKVGDVDEVHQDYFVAKKGLIFSHEHYIPFSAVTRVEHDRVYLNVTKDQIEDQGWDDLPTTQTGSRQATGSVGSARMTGAERTEGERTVQLREEELRAQKRPVETGEVEIRKEVVSEQKTMDVPVTREEVVVERHPVDPKTADRYDAGEIGQDETLRVPVREERVEVEKRPVVTEEISVGKRQVQDTERVSDTVRREEVRLEEEGDVDVRGDEPRRR